MPRQAPLILILLFAIAACAQEEGALENEKLSEAALAISETRIRAIQAERKTIKNDDWAGEYYFGDGRGVNVHLTLAPKNGFVFLWYGCMDCTI